MIVIDKTCTYRIFTLYQAFCWCITCRICLTITTYQYTCSCYVIRFHGEKPSPLSTRVHPIAGLFTPALLNSIVPQTESNQWLIGQTALWGSVCFIHKWSKKVIGGHAVIRGYACLCHFILLQNAQSLSCQCFTSPETYSYSRTHVRLGALGPRLESLNMVLFLAAQSDFCRE